MVLLEDSLSAHLLCVLLGGDVRLHRVLSYLDPHLVVHGLRVG